MMCPVSKTSPWFDRMMAVLSDGEWHDRNQLMVEMGKVIPPGQAMRRAEVVRAQHDATKRPDRKARPRKMLRSDEALIIFGRRNITQVCLKNSAGRLEQRTVDGLRQVRLRQGD